ncbi:MAG: phage protein GemA/Gp16 family protein [Kiritimatiellales bacterium]
MNIGNDERKKIFVKVKEAWTAAGRPKEINLWRYEQMEICGIPSLGECSIEDARRFWIHLVWIIKQAKNDPRAKRKQGPAGGRPKGIIDWSENKEQLEKVGALLADQGLAWDYADGIAKRMFGASVLRVDTLDRKQLRAVIAALTKRQQKHGGRRKAVAHV